MAYKLRPPGEWPCNMILTVKCDLSCRACNKACFIKPPWMADMTEETFVSILDKIEAAGFLRFLRILGGEPTLHPRCLDLMRLAKRRGFDQWIYSNAHSLRARAVLARVRREGLGQIVAASAKPDGSSDSLYMPWVFCSPTDLDVPPNDGCWQLERCGYDACQLGFSPCAGGFVSNCWLTPELWTWDLTRLTDPAWMAETLRKVCAHCGTDLHKRLNLDLAGLGLNLNEDRRIRPFGPSHTPVTRIWIDMFERYFETLDKEQPCTGSSSPTLTMPTCPCTATSSAPGVTCLGQSLPATVPVT